MEVVSTAEHPLFAEQAYAFLATEIRELPAQQRRWQWRMASPPSKAQQKSSRSPRKRASPRRLKAAQASPRSVDSASPRDVLLDRSLLSPRQLHELLHPSPTSRNDASPHRQQLRAPFYSPVKSCGDANDFHQLFYASDLLHRAAGVSGHVPDPPTDLGEMSKMAGMLQLKYLLNSDTLMEKLEQLKLVAAEVEALIKSLAAYRKQVAEGMQTGFHLMLRAFESILAEVLQVHRERFKVYQQRSAILLSAALTSRLAVWVVEQTKMSAVHASMTAGIASSQANMDALLNQLTKLTEENERLRQHAESFHETHSSLEQRLQMKESMLANSEEGYAALRTLHAKTLLELDRTRAKLREQEQLVAEQRHRLHVRDRQLNQLMESLTRPHQCATLNPNVAAAVARIAAEEQFLAQSNEDNNNSNSSHREESNIHPRPANEMCATLLPAALAAAFVEKIVSEIVSLAATARSSPPAS